MVIIVLNGPGDKSSNPRKVHIDFSSIPNTLEKGVNPFILPLAMGKCCYILTFVSRLLWIS